MVIRFPSSVINWTRSAKRYCCGTVRRKFFGRVTVLLPADIVIADECRARINANIR